MPADTLPPSVHKDRWASGESAWFEYHCWEHPDSGDAPAWYRSHQQVEVLHETDHDGDWGTFTERADQGTPRAYRVRFADGLEWDVTEDELMIDPAGFRRPAPPAAPAAETRS